VKVHIHFVDGHTFVAKSESNHWVPMDTSALPGGNAANDPFQLFVTGLGTCTCVDVVDILTKGRHELKRFQCDVEVTRRDSSPKVVRAVHFNYKVEGVGLTEETVRRAVELSLTKYCSASLSLDRSIPFTAQAAINGDQTAVWPMPRSTQWFE
jgi:putative redox protein